MNRIENLLSEIKSPESHIVNRSAKDDDEFKRLRNWIIQLTEIVQDQQICINDYKFYHTKLL